MGVERSNFYCRFGSGRIEISGARWFYGDRQIQTICGWEFVGDGNNSNRQEAGTVSGQAAKDRLVLLVAVLKGDGVGIRANQRDSSRRFEFYCDPSRVERALLELPNQNVDRGRGAGSLQIVKVYRKRVISRR